jgi:hypothetical protein
MRRNQFLCALEQSLMAEEKFSSIAYFGHGTWQSTQWGYDLDTIAGLADALRGVMAPDSVIALYACSTADGPSTDQTDARADVGPGCEAGIADRLRDALVASHRGWRGHVDAHKVAGHTTENPYVVRLGADSTRWVVEPHSANWKWWVSALKKTDLRLRFPLLTIEQIEKEFTPSA